MACEEGSAPLSIIQASGSPSKPGVVLYFSLWAYPTCLTHYFTLVGRQQELIKKKLKHICDANWCQTRASEHIWSIPMRGANGPQNSSLIQNIEETCVKCQNGCVGVGSVGGEEELWMSNKQHLRWNIQKQQLGIHKPVPGWQAKAVSLSQFWVEQVDLQGGFGQWWLRQSVEGAAL